MHCHTQRTSQPRFEWKMVQALAEPLRFVMSHRILTVCFAPIAGQSAKTSDTTSTFTYEIAAKETKCYSVLLQYILG